MAVSLVKATATRLGAVHIATLHPRVGSSSWTSWGTAGSSWLLNMRKQIWLAARFRSTESQRWKYSALAKAGLPPRGDVLKAACEVFEDARETWRG